MMSDLTVTPIRRLPPLTGEGHRLGGRSKWFSVTTAVIFLSILAPSAMASDLFSPVNRFSLSYEYSDSLRAAVIGSRPVFLSRPTDWRYAQETGTLAFNAGGQRAAASFNATAGGIVIDKNTMGFGAINGRLTLNSEHLDARVELSTFTVDRLNSGFPVENDYERFITGVEKPLSGAMDFRFGVKEAYLTAKFKNLDVSVGKMKLRWGPGYKGTLALSGTTYAPFFFYHINFGLGDVFKLSSFLAGYDDEERFAGEVAGIDSMFVRANGRGITPLPARYGAGQRIDLRIGKHVQLGLYELADFFGGPDLNRFANPLQFYYAANNASGTNYANLLGGFDCNVTFSPWRFYGEILDDDVTMFEHAGNPDKYAFQLGAQVFPRGKVTQAGIEYTHVTRYTYGHYTALNRHTLWDEPLGWPWGNDMESFAAHAIIKVSEKLRAKTEACLWFKGWGRLTDDWYADGSPDLDHAPYWPQYGNNIVSFSVSADWRPRSWMSLDCCYRPMWTDGKPSNAIYTYLTLTPCLRRSFGR